MPPCAKTTRAEILLWERDSHKNFLPSAWYFSTTDYFGTCDMYKQTTGGKIISMLLYLPPPPNSTHKLSSKTSMLQIAWGHRSSSVLISLSSPVWKNLQVQLSCVISCTTVLALFHVRSVQPGPSVPHTVLHRGVRSPVGLVTTTAVLLTHQLAHEFEMAA